MSYFEVVIFAIVEGLTEFLPISSTGHLILVAKYLGIEENQFVINFNIIIQFGAILAVLFEYRQRFTQNFKIYKTLAYAMIPTAGIGVLVGNRIDAILSSAVIVSVALILGGIVLIFIDRLFDDKPKNSIDKLTPTSAIWIGLIQCLAFVPGVSRAAATIIGGRLQGLSRVEATEFSFFLAVPTITGAALYKGISSFPTILPEQVNMLLLGIALSFVFALLAIRIFIRLVSRFGLKYFGYYRIILGLTVLLLS